MNSTMRTICTNAAMGIGVDAFRNNFQTVVVCSPSTGAGVRVTGKVPPAGGNDLLVEILFTEAEVLTLTDFAALATMITAKKAAVMQQIADYIESYNG